MIIAILQARMSSSRLPGKVLKPVLGRPVLELHLERLARSGRIDRVVVATSAQKDDDPIEGLCRRLEVDCFRGSLDNVLDRFYHAAKKYKPDHVVRLTGDCPLADWVLIDELIDYYLAEGCDYANNADPPTLPDGLDAEIFTFSALEQAWKEAELPSELEHVTPFIRKRPERFDLRVLKYDPDLSALRWTLDEAEDYEFITSVYEALYAENPLFRTPDVLEYLDRNPNLTDINTRFERNEGAKKSRVADKEFLAQKKG